MTCQQWIDEYYETAGSKQEHSSFNGRKVFNREDGEHSMQDIAKMFDVHYTAVAYWIKTGRLKATKKGFYNVVSQADLNAFMANEIKEKIAENA